jgi:1,4-alpha-glucan branching enzyme
MAVAEEVRFFCGAIAKPDRGVEFRAFLADAAFRRRGPARYDRVGNDNAKGAAMISKGRKKGTIRFAYTPRGEADTVSVAGDFSDWQPVRMRKQKQGQYVAILPVGPGTHEYKFVVDDRWVADPENDTCAVNPFGTVNSVAIVKPK